MIRKSPLELASGADSRTASTEPRALPPLFGEELAALVQDIQQLLSRDQWRESPELQTLVTRLDGFIGKARVLMVDAGGEVASRAKNAARATDDWVHDEPWKAIGIAAAVGLGVGFLAARR